MSANTIKTPVRASQYLILFYCYPQTNRLKVTSDSCKMKKLLIVCFSACFVTSYGSKDLPKELPRCHRFDKDINKCILDATEVARPLIVKGIPELGLPSFDPLTLDEIVIEQGTKALNFKATLKNVVIHGLSKYKYSKFNFDADKLLFDTSVTFNGLWIEGDYDIEGKILAAPISGSGNFSATLDTCQADVIEELKIETRKGEEYLVTTHTNTSISVKRPRGTLDGLFGGNKDLGVLMNKLLNDNAEEFFKEMVPILENLISDLLENVFFKALMKVPYDKLFPK